jgi:hypothetical protein
MGEGSDVFSHFYLFSGENGENQAGESLLPL